MSAQVRTGIEGLLGIQVLRELVSDLQKYADHRRYTAGAKVTNKTIEKIRNDLLALEHEEKNTQEELGQIAGEWERLTNRRNSLTRELTSMGAGATDTTVKDRYEELTRIKKALDDLRTQRDKIIASDISLALTGRALRDATVARLHQESIREEWETGRRQGEAGLERFLHSMSSCLADVEPPLHGSQITDVLSIVEAKWDELWHPAPTGCAPDYRHLYARGAERDRIRQHLLSIERLSTGQIRAMLDEQRRLRIQRQRVENDIANLEGLSPQIEQKAAELKDLNDKIDRLAVDKGRFERELETITSQLSAKRQELARNVQSFHQAAPRLRLADRADRVANVLQTIIKDAVPHEIQTVAQAITVAFKAMSHKNIVDHVEIAEDCTVRLLSAGGFNVRELAASAGEQQIFAQALISAIARVSQRDFPIVVDTPLGRLDDAHRAGVFRHFTGRMGQVILLSTDTEVVGPYLDVVKPRLSATYRVEYEHEGQIGRSRAFQGYFQGTEV